jgi:hypothetical protein
MIYIYDVNFNLFGKDMNIVKKNMEVLLDDCKKAGV